MSHHGKGPLRVLEEMQRVMRELDPESQKKFGATGKFPQGTLGVGDEGEIAFGVTNFGGKVMLNFGKPVSWMACDPEQAVELANALIKHARDANRIIARERRAKPLTVTL